ncbi:hypothetical protein HRI_004776000 [Hibiscus trionum]|uniref:Uncharacterized protein n=1 Tax=Hibiscus trionum TaxID=183268 RepID=A0A9W7JAF0_HIBTR|nr:hypothetical protein HRI_004773500 [Hibiscus trionum]GMJ11068.1 hypothetical protein HRI_004776000 [Hibiscus trionum]
MPGPLPYLKKKEGERDRRSIAQDHLFLLPWGRPVNKLASKPARPRGIKRSLPVLTWISGDGIRRPEATSSRGRSLALADRLARIFGAQYEILFSCKTRSDKEKLQRLLRSKILALTFS